MTIRTAVHDTKDGTLGPTELDVLVYIEEHAPVRVKDAAEHFAAHAGLARTTVLTVMERLRNKGHVTRSRAGGVWVYEPAASHGNLLHSLIQGFVRKALGGRVSPFVAYLAQEGKLTSEEAASLADLARKLDDEQN